MILYDGNDMVKIGCHDCEGCSSCCRGMGQSILLDPGDLFWLQQATGQSFAQLMQEKIELYVEDGLILPAVKMREDTDCCGFLTAEGRCGIHAFRPGLCRLFPLGRNYDENGLRYFVLEDACTVRNRTKVKIRKWLGVAEPARYEAFLTTWHDLRREARDRIAEQRSDEFARQINVKLLEIFYRPVYDTAGDFYEQFAERMARWRAEIK